MRRSRKSDAAGIEQPPSQKRNPREFVSFFSGGLAESVAKLETLYKSIFWSRPNLTFVDE